MAFALEKLFLIAKCVLVNEKKEILVLKRTDYKNDGTGDLWDFLGGSVDKCEDLNEAVKREVFEEIGVKLDKVNVFKVLSGEGTPVGMFIFNFFYARVDSSVEIRLSSEHSEFRWIDVEELGSLDFYGVNQKPEYVREMIDGLK